MSDLFRIELQQSGTPETESFASYMYRLAYEHGVSAGEIVRYIFRKNTSEVKKYKDKNGVPKILISNDLVGTGSANELMVDFIEKETGQEFYKSTFWFLKTSFARCINEVRKEFFWCPECFKEMDIKGVPPYFKLIWHVSSITHCHIHRTRLLGRCPKCDKKQNTMIRKYPNNLCQHCGESLMKRNTSLSQDDFSNSWYSAGDDVLMLLNKLSYINRKDLPKDGIVKSYEFILNYCLNNSDYELLEQLSDFRRPFRNTKRKVSLLIARRSAYILGIPLFDFIVGDLSQLTFGPVLNLTSARPAFMRPVKKVIKDHEEILLRINNFLSSQSNPPSLRRTAKYVGVSVGYIDYRFEELSKKIKKEHQEHKSRLMLKKKYKAQKAALGFFLEDKYSKYNKSRKQAYKVLREETGLPKFILKQAIQNAYAALSSLVN